MTTRKILVSTSSAAISVTLSGARGANGYGVPVGGDAGAVLAKSASGDYLTSWLTTTAFGRGLLAIADATGLRSAAGLANVDNTADASKPVSTAQALAISAAVAAEATIRGSADTALDGRLDVLEADPITATAVASGLSGKAALSHTHAIADTTGLQTAIDAKAPLASPALTGTPTSPTAVDGTSTTQIASTAFVQSAVGAEATIRSGADTALDGRLDVLEADPITATAVASGLAGKLAIASNLGDLNNASTARTNLGLGSLATQSGTFSGTSSGTNTGDQTITLTGDVTGSGGGSFAATVATNAITNAKAAQMASNTIKGNNTGATANASDLTAAQVRGVLALPTSTVAGRVALYTDTAGSQGQSSAIFESAGNVGIGTTAPNTTLHISGGGQNEADMMLENITNGASLYLSSYSGFTGTPAVIVSSNHPLPFFTNALERMRIDASGNVGIGTTAPDSKLVITDANSSVLKLNVTNDPGNYYTQFVNNYDSAEPFYIMTGTGAGEKIFGQKVLGNGNRNSYLSGFYGLALATGAVNPVDANVRMLITQAGNVGIGTTAPGTRLEIKQSADTSIGGLRVTNSSGNRATYLWSDGSDNGRLDSGATGTGNLIVNSGGGNVGIGTTAPDSKLVITDANSSVLKLNVTNDPGNYYTQFVNNYDSAEPFYIMTGAGAGEKIFGQKVLGNGNRNSYLSGFYGLALATGAVNPVDANVRMLITQAGNVGIGTTSPRVRLDVAGPVAVGSYTVATVPSAALGAGQIVYVVNEAGGACLASSDGTYWRRTSDRAVVVAANGSQSLLALEYNGLALDFTDQSARIKHTATPANEYDSAGQVSAGALVGPGGKLTYTAPSLKLTRQSDGVYRYQAHNIYLNSAAPANQSITVVSGATYSITITGTVSVTASGAATGTWTAGTNTFTAATTTLTLGSTSGAGTVHLRRTPSADTYIATTSAAKYDLPYEWDAAGSALGILVEESRTNLLPNFKSPAAWGIVNVTITAETAPDGTATAAKFEVTTSAATVSSTAATVSATSVTASVYIKKGSGATDANRFTVRNSTTSAMLLGISINYDTLAITYTTGSSGASLESVGGGWYRLVMIVTSGITSGDTIQFYIAYLGGSETAGEFCYVWGRQLEAGSLATSPIETFGSTVTRAGDNISLATTAFPYNQPAGTLYAKWKSNSGGIENQRIAMLANSSGSGRVVDLHVSINTVISYNGSGNIGSSVQIANAVNAAAVAYSSGDYVLVHNGGSPGVRTDALVNTANNIYIGQYTNGGMQGNCHIQSLIYLPRRMTNAELQTLTTP